MPGEWRVPPDHAAFAGHFPGRPIVPGVILLDQALLHAQARWGAGPWTIAQAKFLRPVGPGERLQWRLDEGAAGLVSVTLCDAQGQRVMTAQLRRAA